MIRGGYKIIDLKNKKLQDGEGMVYEGIYDAIEECQKPIILSGLNIDGLEFPDLWVNGCKSGSNFEFTVELTADGNNPYTITITDTDVVTVRS